MKILLTLFISFIFTSCTIKSEKIQTTNNNIILELIFEHDGCKTYRFMDSGRYQYITTCPCSDTVN